MEPKYLKASWIQPRGRAAFMREEEVDFRRDVDFRIRFQEEEVEFRRDGFRRIREGEVDFTIRNELGF
ncbi:hypothetical protein CDL15_Pgr020999 [Punica granatum]|uniref:Uncharacterized protein n=1 Tax=Punica granatum TaxID=22663 RepID=A0A218Y0E7_PUNGR|nr:hypothetical protein CDL15_Pgr020999 [Punica granatum]